MNLEAGMLAKSKAGRDKERIYVIIRVEDEYVYVADGDFRPLRRMKRKNNKHLQPVTQVRLNGEQDDRAIREMINKFTRQGERYED